MKETKCTFKNYKPVKPLASFTNNKLEEEKMLAESMLRNKNNKPNNVTMGNSMVLKNNQMMMKKKEMNEKIPKIILENYISKIYLKAIPIDESAKNRYKPALKNMISENLSKVDFSKAIKNSNTIKILLEAVEKKSKQVIKDKSKKLQEDEDFDYDDIYEDSEENEEDYDFDIEEIDTDELADIIKDKVITVIQDEEDMSSRQEELFEDINNAKSMNESATVVSNGINEYSLFK